MYIQSRDRSVKRRHVHTRQTASTHVHSQSAAEAGRLASPACTCNHSRDLSIAGMYIQSRQHVRFKRCGARLSRLRVRIVSISVNIPPALDRSGDGLPAGLHRGPCGRRLRQLLFLPLAHDRLRLVLFIKIDSNQSQNIHKTVIKQYKKV